MIQTLVITKLKCSALAVNCMDIKIRLNYASVNRIKANMPLQIQ